MADSIATSASGLIDEKVNPNLVIMKGLLDLDG